MKKSTADKLRARPLWTCPRCRHRFVTRNLSHSCSRFTLGHHFRGRPRARALYAAFLAAVRGVAPVRVQVSKTRIAFMTRMRFAGVTPRRDHVRAALLLSRQARHPTLVRIECYGPTYFGHTFEIREASQIDSALRALIREAHEIGEQKQLEAPKASPTQREAIARRIRETGRSVVLFEREKKAKKAKRA